MSEIVKIPLRSLHYHWETLLYKEDLSRKEIYKQEFGPLVLTRKKDGTADKVRFRVYCPEKNIQI